MNIIEPNELNALAKLSTQDLIAHVVRLQEENARLRQKLARSAYERSVLQQKQRMAIKKIKGIISQLREKMRAPPQKQASE